MNICGIITEYNPMHLGHDYQLKEALKHTDASHTILIMSGNFVQRGEPAILDKYARAKAAVLDGIDLVIELPAYFATASAEYFAGYAIRLLNSTGIVSHLNFGSETGDIDPLQSVAQVLQEEPIGYKILLNDYLKDGLSFPSAREKALLKYNENHGLISSKDIRSIETPNNILGIEYIKALYRLNSTIIPTTIRRIGAMYHDEDSQVAIPSATSLRKHLKDGLSMTELKDKMPASSFDALNNAILNNTAPLFVDDMFPYVRHILLRSSSQTLLTYCDVSEGLENRFKKNIIDSYSYEDFIDKVMTKRYTRTRIARALLHIYLGHKKSQFDQYYKDMLPYLKVLAFNAGGQQLLKSIKETNEDLPIIVNNRQGYKKLDDLQKQCYLADLDSTLMYNHLIAMKYNTVVKNDYQVKIIPI